MSAPVIVDLHRFGLFAESETFRLASSSLGSVGLLSRELLPAGPVDQRWMASLTAAAGAAEHWRPFDGLIASLRGSVGLTRTFIPSRRKPQFDADAPVTAAGWDGGATWDDGTGWLSGPLPPAVAVDQAAARGARLLVLRGLPASTAAALRWGDLFEIRPNGVPARHGHLYMVTGTAGSDAAGKAAVSFEPGLRAGVASGDMVVLTEPTSVFRLADEGQGEMSVTAPAIGRFGLSLVEVLPLQ